MIFGGHGMCRTTETEPCYRDVTEIGMTTPDFRSRREKRVSKDKGKKKKKQDRKAAKGTGSSKLTKSLKGLSQNRLVADVVAAALVATAAALKDSKKAQRHAADAGDELQALAKDGAERGNAMWKLALDIGRRALDEIGTKKPERKRSTKSSKK